MSAPWIDSDWRKKPPSSKVYSWLCHSRKNTPDASKTVVSLISKTLTLSNTGIREILVCTWDFKTNRQYNIKKIISWPHFDVFNLIALKFTLINNIFPPFSSWKTVIWLEKITILLPPESFLFWMVSSNRNSDTF